MQYVLLLIAVELEALNISLKVNCKKTEHMFVGDFMQVWPRLTVVGPLPWLTTSAVR